MTGSHLNAVSKNVAVNIVLEITRIFMVKLDRLPFCLVTTKRPNVSEIENTAFRDKMNQLTELGS